MTPGMHNFSLFFRKLWWFTALSLMFVTVSCANLTEVSALSSLANSANTSLPALVNDFKLTCERMNDYAPRTSSKRDCSVYDKIMPAVMQDQSVLTDYLSALGKLASDGAAGYPKAFESIGASFKDAGLDVHLQNAGTAAGKLAEVLANAITEGYRKRQVAKLIDNGDQYVQALTTGLAQIVDGGYKQLLDNESAALESYYQTALVNHSAQEPLTAILITKSWREDAAAVQVRISAANAYGKLMKSIAAAHAKLKKEDKHLDSKDLIKELAPELGNMADATVQIQAAFKYKL